MRKNRVLFLTQAAMIAAIYVVLTVFFAPFSFGQIQVRIAEALTILPFFTSAAIPGVTIGCLVGNAIGGAIVPDIILGSLATLLGTICTYLLRQKSEYLAPLPAILANTVIIPLILRYAYGVPLPIPLLMLTVGLGEILSCGVLGMILLRALKKYRYRIFKKV